MVEDSSGIDLPPVSLVQRTRPLVGLDHQQLGTVVAGGPQGVDGDVVQRLADADAPVVRVHVQPGEVAVRPGDDRTDNRVRRRATSARPAAS